MVVIIRWPVCMGTIILQFQKGIFQKFLTEMSWKLQLLSEKCNIFKTTINKCLPNEVQKCWWASIVFIHRLLRVSQILRVLSSLAETMYLPPGWKTVPRTQLSCPISVNRHSPAPTSHTWKQTMTLYQTVYSLQSNTLISKKNSTKTNFYSSK